MPIKTKRWCDKKAKGDGLRILICRYRPRALPKADETWDTWLKELGPSKELHADFYGKNGPPIGFSAYVERYLAEIANRPPEVQEQITTLAELVKEGKTITLLCSSACEDASRCHRTLLAKIIQERADALPPRSDTPMS